MNYKGYLKTKHWQSKRREHFHHFRKICKSCGSKKFLNIHHYTYKNLNNEKITDLICLCKNCHQKLHNGDKKIKNLVEKIVKYRQKINEKNFFYKLKKDKQQKQLGYKPWYKCPKYGLFQWKVDTLKFR